MTQRKRIVLVDDEPLVLRASVRALESDAFEILTADSGAAGLALVRRERPDLVLLDVVLPDVNGVEVCRRIKADPELVDTFVILISAYRTASEEQAEGLEGGADGYIARPIANRELLARVQAMARIQAAQVQIRTRAGQQEAVADLGRLAFQAGTGRLLGEAAAVCARMLSAERSEVLLASDRASILSVVAGIGWPAQYVERVRTPDDPASFYGFSLRAGEPVVVRDLAAETRFAVPATLPEHQVASAICAPIPGPSAPLGLLGVYRTEVDGFGPDDAHFVQSVANVVGAAMERSEAEAERQALQARVLEAQKLESLAAMAGGIAHDFNNVLTGLMAHVEFLRAKLAGDAPRLRHLDAIDAAAQRMADLSGQMLAYTGKGVVAVGAVDLRGLIEEMAPLLESIVGRSATLRLDLARDVPPVEGDAGQIRQVILSLVTNAAEAICDDRGMIQVSLRAVSPQDGAPGEAEKPAAGRPYVILEVADTGCGMDAATRARIFEPFFTTKFTGRGLGLSAAQGVVRAHRGSISVESVAGRGTHVRVLLPGLQRVPQAGPAPSPQAAGGKAGGAILVIDDERLVREAMDLLLGASGYRVLAAASGSEGLAILRERADEIAAVVLDMTMPGMNGARVYEAIRSEKIAVPVIVSSGYGEEYVAEHFPAGDRPLFLPKPFTPDAIRAKLRHALAGAQG